MKSTLAPSVQAPQIRYSVWFFSTLDWYWGDKCMYVCIIIIIIIINMLLNQWNCICMNHTVYLFCCMVLTISIYLLSNLKNLKFVGTMHIERIFGYKLHESVKILICLMPHLDFRKLYDLRHLMFITKLSQTIKAWYCLFIVTSISVIWR